MRLLLVEDDGDVAETLTAYLERQGFVVDRAETLAIAQDAILDNDFDLVLLDRLLPDGDGVSLIGYAEAHRRPQRFLLLSALFVLIGTQSIGLGLLGEVLSRTYFESQDKRSYAVSEALNIDQGASRRAA